MNFNKSNSTTSSISSIISTFFDLENFEKLLDNTAIEKSLSNSKHVLHNESKQLILDYNINLVNALINLEKVLQKIDHRCSNLNYDIHSIFAGKTELSKIITSVEQVEYNVNTLLTKLKEFEVIPNSILKSFDQVCDLALKVKKYTVPFQKRLSLCVQYNEINQDMLSSVNNEVMCCIEKLEELSEKTELVNAEETIINMNLEEINKMYSYMKENGSISKYFGFLILSPVDAEIYEGYNSLHDTVIPISQSINYIPLSLDDFFQNSKTLYPDLVMECVNKYENVLKMYESYRRDLREFKKQYITERVQLLAKRIFQIVETDQITLEIAENIIAILKPLEQSFGLETIYEIKLRDMENIANSVNQCENNFQTPQPKSKKSKRASRVFSNPLTDSLNLIPVLEKPEKKSYNEIKIFQTPRHVDNIVHSKENVQIIENIKHEIHAQAKRLTNRAVISSPESDVSSPGSSSEMFSPNPFITPSGKSYQLYKKGNVMTPLTTPRITPTKKYVMLPVDETPNLNRQRASILMPKPLLSYEQSTVINVETVSDFDDTDISNLSNLSDNSAENDGSFLMADDIISSSPRNQKIQDNKSTIPIFETSRFKTSPVTQHQTRIPRFNQNSNSDYKNVNIAAISSDRSSGIPLPIRPESRLGLLRSVSRMENSREYSYKDMNIQTPIQGAKSTLLPRPESKLESIATHISAKLGTNSPVTALRNESVSTTSRFLPRASTVLSQREMVPRRKMAIQLGRLNEAHFSLNQQNIKTRGSTSIGNRNSGFGSRITSI